MIDWRKLLKRIPNTVTVKKSHSFEVVWTTEFKDTHIVGMTRFEPKQILLKTGESNKETVHTYIHELIHAVSDAYDVGLTESQVLKLEKALYYLIKPNNIFKD